MRARAVAVLVSGVLFGGLFPAIAHAETSAEESARLAYERGLRAHAVGDHGAAARAFAEADRAVPSNEAIEAALDAATRADDPVLAMGLVARTEARALDARAKAAREKARTTFADRVARLAVTCGGAVYCHARVDGGEDLDARAPVFVLAGAHTVRVTLDARSFTTDVAARGGAIVAVAAPPEPAPSRPAAPSGVRPGRVVVVVGASLGAVLAGFTVASAVDLFSVRGAFRDARCGADAGALTRPGETCPSLATEGKSAELRTGVLVGATAATVLATLVTELFFVPKSSAGTVSLRPSIDVASANQRVGLEIGVRLR